MIILLDNSKFLTKICCLVFKYYLMVLMLTQKNKYNFETTVNLQTIWRRQVEEANGSHVQETCGGWRGCSC